MIKFHRRHRSGGAFLILLFAFCVCAQTGQPAAAKVDTKTGVITGRVVNENGEPHVNASVWVRPDTPEGLPVTQTTTNRDGVFKLSGLVRGSGVFRTQNAASQVQQLFDQSDYFKTNQ